MAALAIARILKFPISGTYHTALPQYAQILTGDQGLEDLMWKFIVWYYDQMDFIHVPSKSTGDELIQKGIHPEKITIFPRGIDINRFHPSKRNGYLQSHYSIESDLNLLYVGRVSKEKNLHLLCHAYKKLCRTTQNVHLVIVGDGPYMDEMKVQMQKVPCTFAGYLEGEDLAAVYASSDLFIFPSTTDTFGNVVLEAQASGLPVIVTDRGGPQENIVADKTGLVVAADDSQALLEAIGVLVENPGRLKRMGEAARKYMENRSFDGAFIQTWKLYKDLHVKQQKRTLLAG